MADKIRKSAPSSTIQISDTMFCHPPFSSILTFIFLSLLPRKEHLMMHKDNVKYSLEANNVTLKGYGQVVTHTVTMVRMEERNKEREREREKERERERDKIKDKDKDKDKARKGVVLSKEALAGRERESQEEKVARMVWKLNLSFFFSFLFVKILHIGISELTRIEYGIFVFI